MTALLFTLLSLSPALLASEPGSDLLRFKNGDVIHGQFMGVSESSQLLWKSSEAPDNIAFETKNLRKVLFNKGRSQSRLKTKDLVELTNNDRLPGEVLSLDDTSLTFNSDFGGLLNLPREHVRRISLNRHGPEPRYLGPFQKEGWIFQKSQSKGGRKRAKAEEPKEEDEKAPWHLSGGAWYNEAHTSLALETSTFERTSYRFRVAWRNHLNLNIAFCADFHRPAVIDPDLDNQIKNPASDLLLEGPSGHSDPERFGSAYVLSLHSNYIRLQRTGFDANGRPETSSFKSESAHNQLRDQYEAEFETRIDRKKGLIAFFINGRRLAEWEDPAESLSDGGHLAFNTGNNCFIRLSDISISDWNGMPDSALSMQSDTRDIVLLQNGTDRLSGKIISIGDEHLKLASDYATFEIPLEDVSDLYPASNQLLSIEEPSQNSAILHFRPLGRLTLQPKLGTSETLTGLNPSAGELKISLDSVFLIEFDPEITLFDNWDENF